MHRTQFVELIEAFCAHCGLAEPERILYGGPISVNEVIFSLIHNEDSNPDLLFAYCDFGFAPPGREAETYRMLLETNLSLYDGKSPSFAIAPETGRVVLAASYALGETSGAELGKHLAKIAEQAKAWRVDPFFGARLASRPSRREVGLGFRP